MEDGTIHELRAGTLFHIHVKRLAADKAYAKALSVLAKSKGLTLQGAALTLNVAIRLYANFAPIGKCRPAIRQSSE